MNQVSHDRTKHVKIKNHYVLEMVQRRVVELRYIPTESRLLMRLPNRCVEESSSTFKTGSKSWRMSPSLRESVDVCSFMETFL